jgi:gas vesicle protein
MKGYSKLYLMAGIAGFIAGVLYAPNEGRVSRLKLKRRINKMASRAVSELENVEERLKEA